MPMPCRRCSPPRVCCRPLTWKTVLREMGLDLPPAVRIRVWDTTTDTRYMVLPHRPEHTQGWSVDALEALITKESMIGVARLEPPYAGA
ncbi:MAG: hypothetical protein EBV28_06955 [Betaproteobacteria bacterium]|nr:hypothetical protein [Betaproteobacteria bacterium]